MPAQPRYPCRARHSTCWALDRLVGGYGRAVQRFPFSMPSPYATVVLAWGATRDRAWVEVDEDELRARFGFFHLSTPLGNVTGASLHAGPFNPLLAVGVRYSFSDKSVTFGSDVHDLVEIRFERAVSVHPPGLTRHPALWVSVADPEGLVAALG